MPDHLIRQLAPVPALTAAAAATTTLRVGVHVFANDYRNPLMLAREAATLDILSEGRLELGIGAGWMRSDYAQLGIPYDEPKARVDRMVDTVRIWKRLFAGESVDHDGAHFRLRGARLAIEAVQRPHPPLVIGAGGPRMLGIAAREGDIVSLIPQMSREGRPRPSEATGSATDAKVARVREAAGARFDRLELCAWVAHVNVLDAGSPVTAVGAGVERIVTELLGTPYALAGTRSQIREAILRYRQRFAISYWTIPVEAMEAFAPISQDLAGR